MSWVKRRSECSLRPQFEAMQRQVELAVQERNEILKRTAFRVFDGPRSFEVEREGRDQPVRITRERDHILINAPGLAKPWEVHLNLDLDLKCYFNIKPDAGWGKLTLEQVIRLTFEHWFFDGFPE